MPRKEGESVGPEATRMKPLTLKAVNASRPTSEPTEARDAQIGAGFRHEF